MSGVRDSARWCSSWPAHCMGVAAKSFCLVLLPTVVLSLRRYAGLGERAPQPRRRVNRRPDQVSSMAQIL